MREGRMWAGGTIETFRRGRGIRWEGLLFLDLMFIPCFVAIDPKLPVHIEAVVVRRHFSPHVMQNSRPSPLATVLLFFFFFLLGSEEYLSSRVTLLLMAARKTGCVSLRWVRCSFSLRGVDGVSSPFVALTERNWCQFVPVFRLFTRTWPWVCAPDGETCTPFIPTKGTQTLTHTVTLVT